MHVEIFDVTHGDFGVKFKVILNLIFSSNNELMIGKYDIRVLIVQFANVN